MSICADKANNEMIPLCPGTSSKMLHLILLGLSVVGGAFSGCGRPPIHPKWSAVDIVGGHAAVPYSWPWQVALVRGGWWPPKWKLWCSGSLISSQWILTAGHCVYRYTDKPQYFKIRLGVYRYNVTLEKGEVVAELENIILHPQYKQTGYSHDVALIKLKKPVAFTDHIQTVCLPKSDTVVLQPGTVVAVTGWGANRSGGFLSERLMQVKVPIRDFDLCEKAYKGKIEKPVMFCAGSGQKDSCQGDSGGPLVHSSTRGTWYQYGIVSWGRYCAKPDFPGVYSRVSAYCDFIAQNAGVKCL